MGLETASYITGLNTAWPLAGDTKSQGDDHLRLLKSVLTLTFPNASKPYYLPTSANAAGATVIAATDQNKTFRLDASAGDIAVTLPALVAADAGWACKIFRSGAANTNGIVVSPASGVIYSRVGTTATIRIEVMYELTEFFWDGTLWLCTKPGQLIGSSLNWDGATVPPGYRIQDGTAYSSTTFAELFAAIGTATTKDKRGRCEVGVDAGNINMGSSAWGGAVSLATARGGGGSLSLVAANIPTITGTVSVSVSGSISGTTSTVLVSGSGAGVGGGGAFGVGGNASVSGSFSGSGSGSFTSTNTGSTAINIVQPSLAVNKLVRVC